jgi:hypothetical protein
MESFILPPTIEELLSPPGVDEDPTLRIWAYSGRRSPWETAHTFLNFGYDNRHLGPHPMYYLQRVAYRTIVVPSSSPLTPVCCTGAAITAATRWSSSPAPTSSPTTWTSSPWGTKSTRYASWSCSRNSSTGGAGGGVGPVVPLDLQPEARS